MMQLCNTSDLVKGLTKQLGHFTLISNVTFDLVKLRITRQSLPLSFVWSKKHEHDFNRCISDRNGRFH